MVKKKLEDEVAKIFEHIAKKENFRAKEWNSFYRNAFDEFGSKASCGASGVQNII